MMVFPWPDKALHPNARAHWAKKAKAAKSARATAALITRVDGPRTLPEGPLHLWLTFYPPDKRQRDDDNCFAAFKSYRDGIADALGIDDRRFVSRPFLHTEVRKGGQVVVKITGSPEAALMDLARLSEKAGMAL